jgi:outer membrane receptor for ferrienterochelin and colicins
MGNTHILKRCCRHVGLISIYVLITLGSSSVFAQGGTLTGEVTNSSDGEPLFGANIIMKQTDVSSNVVGTATDENGRYEITNIPPGEYSVRISFVGFMAREIGGVVISEWATTTLNAGLMHGAVIVDDVLVTASRHSEKILEAPASVSVIEAEEIGARPVLTPSEHVKGLPAVDVATTGLNQSNVVVRGFNNVFSGALLVLTDNRIARVPSLRYNAYNFLPTANEDIERIEIVSGPGSALYGPNSASGIMHIITKSPFTSEGTTVSIGGGERGLLVGSFFHAKNIKNRIGYKISGQYYSGKDWESSDAYEPDSIRLFRPTPAGPEYVSQSRPNHRDFDIEKISSEARVDFIVNRDLSLIMNGGFNRADGIELTSLGAAQAIDWTYFFVQTRLKYKDLFAQSFVNASDAGDTYLLRTGQLIIDRSRVWAGQIQHRFSPAERFLLTYGFDALLTRPNTEATINGRNEENDNINEYGLYLQSEAELSGSLKFIGAARIDDHNRIEGTIFSPRAALTYQPDPNNNFRLTYNRAYSTPENANLYLDILQAEDPFGVGASFEPVLGFRPDIDVRVQGVPETGFHWRINENGPQFRSSFAPLDPRGLETSDFIDFNDPVFTNVMWTAGRGAVLSGLPSVLAALEIPQPIIDSISTSLQIVTPITVSGVNNALKKFNLDTRSFEPGSIDDIADIDPLKPSYTRTLEFGYKGVLGGFLQFSFDAYRTERDNFVGPLAIETPNIFLDRETLSACLEQGFDSTLADPANADYAAMLAMLDDPAYGGNGNGTPVDELTNIFAYGAAQIPFGTVSPQEALDPEAVLVTFRNFGDIALYGADFSFACALNRYLSLGGSYSYISKNFFEKSAGQVHDIYLNAPKHKFGIYLQYTNPQLGLLAQTRLRFIDAFDMYGPFMGSRVESYTVVDLNARWNLLHNTQLALSVQNLFDNKHSEFVGAPEIGRLTILHVSRSF